MKKRLLLILLALALVVSLMAFAACAKEEEAPPVEEWQWPERLLLTAGRTTSPLYGAQVAWSTPLMDDTGMTVRVVCQADVQLRQMWVKEGRFFTIAPYQYRSILYAAKGFAHRDGGPWQSRIWMPCGVAYSSPAVRGDSGIKTPYDVKPGTNISMITYMEEPQQSIYGLLAWGQVDPEDVNFIAINNIDTGARFLIDGKVDITVGHITGPIFLEVEASPHGLSFITYDAENDPEGAQRYLDWSPFSGFGIATGGCPNSEGIPMNMDTAAYITSVNTDPELIYQMVKWLDENYDRYKESSSWAASMTLDNLMQLAEAHYEPIHEGTVRYLEEKGLWTEELEARRQYNIEQMTLWVDAYHTAISMADDKGLVIDPENDEWQEFWENYRDSLDLPLLALYQGPGKEQLRYSAYYDRWEQVKPKW